MYYEKGVSTLTEITASSSGNDTITLSGYLYWTLAANTNDQNPVILGPPHAVLPRFHADSPGGSTSDITEWAFYIGDTTSSNTNTFNYDIVQPVTYPVKPEKPNRLLLFMGALLASFCASAGLIIMRVQMEQRMPTIYHLREVFDLPILGSISKTETLSDNKSSAADNAMWYGERLKTPNCGVWCNVVCVAMWCVERCKKPNCGVWWNVVCGAMWHV